MATNAPFGTDLQLDFDVKLRGGQLVQVPRGGRPGRKTDQYEEGGGIRARAAPPKRNRQLITETPTKRTHPLSSSTGTENEGFGRPWPTEIGADAGVRLPRIAENVSSSKCATRKYKRGSQEGLVTAAARQRSGALLGILDPAMEGVHNTERALEDILESCTRFDYRRQGVLENQQVLRVFRVFGIRLTETDLSKLAQMTNCSLGTDHILYHKLLRTLINIFSSDNLHLDSDILEKNTYTSTPCASVESHSPASVEDYAISFPHETIPPLTDRTNKTDTASHSGHKQWIRLLQTQPRHLSTSTKLPPITPRLTQTCPPCHTSHLHMSGRQDHSAHTQSKMYVEGIHCLENALRSCVDNDGLMECDCAYRMVRNYSLVYRLQLPLTDIQHFLHTNCTTDTLTPSVPVDSLIEHLHSVCSP